MTAVDEGPDSSEKYNIGQGFSQDFIVSAQRLHNLSPWFSVPNLTFKKKITGSASFLMNKSNILYR